MNLLDNLSPQRRYELKSLKCYTFRLNIKHDADVIAEIEKQDNKQGYVKALIRADIERSKTMKQYHIKPEFENQWGSEYSPSAVITEGDIETLSRGWEMSVDEIRSQLEEI